MTQPSRSTQRTPRQGDLIRPPESAANTRRQKRDSDRAPKPVGPGAILVLFIFILIGFAPIFGSGMLWSDYDLPERSRYESMEHWTDAWTLESIRAEDPLSLTTYFLEQAIPLPTPQVHRAINLLLHLCAAFLLLKILSALKLSAALSTALVFALHPATVQTIFWPGYRSEIVGLVIILAALFFAARNRSSRDYLLVVLLTALACLVHPAALAIPVILALIILFREKHIHFSAYNRVLPLVCICLFLGVWLHAGATAETAVASAGERMNQMGQNMFFFIRQALLPLQGGLFHPFKTQGSHQIGIEMNLLPFVLFVPFFILIAFNIKKSWARATLLGLSAYLLLVIYGVTQQGRFVDGAPAHEDHAQYIALPAILALLIGAVGGLIHKMGTGGKALWAILFSIFLLVETAVTISFSYAIGGPPRMWQQMTEQWPESWVPKAALIESITAGEESLLTNEEKIQMLNEILEQRPDLNEQRIQLARIYVLEGQMSNAIREYKRLLRETTPSNELLGEAARLFDRAGLAWEASNARQRMQAPTE